MPFVRLAYVQSDDHFVLSSVLEPWFRLKWTSSLAEEMAASKVPITEHMDLLMVEQTAAADQPGALKMREWKMQER